jgi:hypothetical protein
VVQEKVFDDNDSVFVTAPTGAAAYNVGGSTIHREFKINVRDVPGYNTLYDNTKKRIDEETPMNYSLIL